MTKHEYTIFDGRLHALKDQGMPPPSPRMEKRGKLRRLTSLSLMKERIRGFFRPEPRDTIVMEDDEEDCHRRQLSLFDLVGPERSSSLSEAESEAVSSRHQWEDEEQFAETRRQRLASSAVTLPKRPVEPQRRYSTSYEPSKEMRWCLNCSKCYQKQLSRYEQFCGLDCQTAYNVRD